MKKILALILACMFAIATIAACADGTPAADGSASQADAATAETMGAAPEPEEIHEDTTPTANFDDRREITVVSRESGSGTRDAFVELTGVQVSVDGTTTDMTSLEAAIASGTSAVMTNVAGDTFAIGYISTGSVNDTIRTVDIDGVAPTSENILAGAYRIARPFIIVTMDGLSDVAQDFINFVLSSEGQEIVAGRYIPVDQNAPAFESNGASGTVVVGGSTSVAPVFESLAEAYLEINPGATVEVHSTGSGAGISGAIDGILDIGLSSRDIRDSEMEDLYQQITMAMDGIAVIVNNDNPIVSLTMEEVREIFTGEKTRWSEVG